MGEGRTFSPPESVTIYYLPVHLAGAVPCRAVPAFFGELMKRKSAEYELQKTVAQFLDWALPEGSAHSSIGHGIALGDTARERGIRGTMLRAMGVKPGWPDITIAWQTRGYAIELKTKSGSLSPEQRDMHARLKKAGWQVAVCRSLDEVVGTLRGWNIPLRAVAA